MRDGECDLLDGLTGPQRAAAGHVDGPLLVLAGPGSGKTRVITRRVAHLVRGVGVAPWNVLAITFTNKAAGEMRERVGALLTERQARAVTVCTFHALCARLIRQYAERLGLPPGYSIYDTSDQKSAVKSALTELEINTKNFPPASMLGTISNAKNELIDADAYARTASDFYTRTVARVYQQYEKVLRRNNALDFDDLLMWTVQLLKVHEDVRSELQERFRYILVDEYQDTNHAQFMIASMLGSAHGNVMATGDPDQSIYGWRGANIRNILEFETHYPNAVTVRLEQNYRSTKRILAAADALIQKNRARKHKALFTLNEVGDPVKLVTCYDEQHEARYLVEQLREHHEQAGLAWGEMAVMYRMNSLSRVIEDALRNAGVPYQIARGTAFYDRKEIKDALAYLRVIANPSDEVTLFRVINTPARGVSTATVKLMQAHGLSKNVSADVLLRDPTLVGGLNTRAQVAVGKFGKLVSSWRNEAGLDAASPMREQATTNDGMLLSGMTPTDADNDVTNLPGGAGGSLRELVERVLRESGLEDFYRGESGDPDQDRLANLGELVSSAQQFEDQYAFELEMDGVERQPTLAEKLLAFLERVALVSDVDGLEGGDGAVTLMTLHAAKGLEFPLVALIGFEDGLLPHERANVNAEELEEERRLAFVGITRAERHLYLTHALRRTVYGQTLPTIQSRFVRELPMDALEVIDESESAFEDDGRAEVMRSRADRTAMMYPPGSRVRHPQFGLGQVVTIGRTSSGTRARVMFERLGEKTLVLEYARLERV